MRLKTSAIALQFSNFLHSKIPCTLIGQVSRTSSKIFLKCQMPIFLQQVHFCSKDHKHEKLYQVFST